MAEISPRGRNVRRGIFPSRLDDVWNCFPPNVARCKIYDVTQLPCFHDRRTKTNHLFTGRLRIQSPPITTRHWARSRSVFEDYSVGKPFNFASLESQALSTSTRFFSKLSDFFFLFLADLPNVNTFPKRLTGTASDDITKSNVARDKIEKFTARSVQGQSE